MTFGDISPQGVDDDARSLGCGTARSLKTASSLTVCGNEEARWVESKNNAQDNEHRVQCRNDQSRLRRMSRRGLDATLQSIKAQLEAEDVPAHVYEDLLELHRVDVYSEEIHKRAWDLILAEMSRGRIHGLIHVLRSWALDDLVSFFTLVSSAEKSLWDNYPGTVLPRQWVGFPPDKSILVYHADTSFFYMVIAVLSDLREVLDQSQVLQVLQLYPNLRPVALLFQNSQDKTTYPDLDHFFTYLNTSYSDPLNLPDGLLPFIKEYTPKRAAAVFFDRSDPELVSGVVDRLLHEIRTCKANHLSSSEPATPEQSYSTPRKVFECRHQDLEHTIIGAKVHPSSPFLCFAIYLAYESQTAAQMLLERGLTRLVEQLYDSYDDEKLLSDAWIDGVSAHGHLTMLHLCYFLLLAASRHCDLSVYVVKEELSEHLRQKSRELSERWFGVMWCE